MLIILYDIILGSFGWLRLFVTQELCKDTNPLIATNTSMGGSAYSGIKKCEGEAKKLEKKNANFMVFLLIADENGNNCFIYEKCNEKDLKRNLPGISFQKKQDTS